MIYLKAISWPENPQSNEQKVQISHYTKFTFWQSFMDYKIKIKKNKQTKNKQINK